MKYTMQQTKKRWMLLAVIMSVFGAIVLTSCSVDNPVLKTDNKPWTVSTADMDPTVKPGDDFFMYCNGGYWQSTSVQEDSAMIVSFVRTNVVTDIQKKLDALTLPSLEVLKAHKAQTKPTTEELQAFVTQRLQPLKEASTLKEANQTFG